MIDPKEAALPLLAQLYDTTEALAQVVTNSSGVYVILGKL